MHDATRVVRAGLPPPVQGAPFRPGPTFASTYHLAGDPAEAEFRYGRFDNPTWRLYEEALAELEGGTSVVFASGMAAVAAVFGVTLAPGDVAVLPSDSYYTSRLLAEEQFAALGVRIRMAPTAGGAQGEILEGARLLWLETPANPGLDVCDVAALAAEGRRRGVLVAVDNTTATPLGQRPLELGADFSVASDTKAMTGHSDLLLGHVAARDPAWADRIRSWRTRFGAVPGPMEVWLAHRSLPTLDVRLERMCANALAVAGFLQAHPAVRAVRYPGLRGDPAHALASRQMKRYGHVLGFELASEHVADGFLAACRLVDEATSFGGTHTTAERRARWGGDAVPEGYIRLSAGLEHPEDLLSDIGGALGRIAGD